jgi:hypothetical protein
MKIVFLSLGFIADYTQRIEGANSECLTTGVDLWSQFFLVVQIWTVTGLLDLWRCLQQQQYPLALLTHIWRLFLGTVNMIQPTGMHQYAYWMKWCHCSDGLQRQGPGLAVWDSFVSDICQGLFHVTTKWLWGDTDHPASVWCCYLTPVWPNGIVLRHGQLNLGSSRQSDEDSCVLGCENGNWWW